MGISYNSTSIQTWIQQCWASMKGVVFKLDKVLVVIKVEISFTNSNNVRMKTTNNIPDFRHFCLKEGISFIPMGNLDSLIFSIAISILCLIVGDHREC